ncbi:hypothetical protein LCGC14_1926620 [marine sediment metagenome]|uniref:Uncharacterized protein n=1 Tax=marine sediment metagenome TaxID=412755 RepID=A0A0F9FP63_9ZZZZ
MKLLRRLREWLFAEKKVYERRELRFVLHGTRGFGASPILPLDDKNHELTFRLRGNEKELNIVTLFDGRVFEKFVDGEGNDVAYDIPRGKTPTATARWSDIDITEGTK